MAALVTALGSHHLHQVAMDVLTPRSLPGQMPHADLGALPTFLVYRYTIRLPGVRDLQEGGEMSSIHQFVSGRSIFNEGMRPALLNIYIS